MVGETDSALTTAVSFMVFQYIKVLCGQLHIHLQGPELGFSNQYNGDQCHFVCATQSTLTLHLKKIQKYYLFSETMFLLFLIIHSAHYELFSIGTISWVESSSKWLVTRRADIQTLAIKFNF